MDGTRMATMVVQLTMHLTMPTSLAARRQKWADCTRMMPISHACKNVESVIGRNRLVRKDSKSSKLFISTKECDAARELTLVLNESVLKNY